MPTSRSLQISLLLMMIIKIIFARAHNEVVVRVIGGEDEAQLLAEETGHLYRGPVLGFRDTYIFIADDDIYPIHRKRGMGIAKRLADDNRVLWADNQLSKSRQKRDYIDEIPEVSEMLRSHIDHKKIFKKPLDPNRDRTFNDELWTHEWYLQDTRSRSDLPKLDLNVLPVYKAGITGKNVRISILDDGIEYTHDDLKNNFDAEISYDCNEEDNNPLPRYDAARFNSHGTRCAGEIAMAADNKKCGVGIAYNAKIGGVKLLDGIVTDRIEGTALSYAQDLVDIYSASWGPNDDGKTVDGPGRLAQEALQRGITEGRQGKGTIYVWASGNGGSKGDNCNCDGYLASPYTVSIGSASQKGEFPWYGEACASTLAVTYSSGAYQDQMIATTDLYNECTIKHTGTSASAPLAAGIIALALEANPNLTWRDIQHLIAWTAEKAPLADTDGWQKNAVGFWFNTKFGFGLMNAFGLVKAASNWTSVPPKYICTVTVKNFMNQSVSYGNARTIPIYTSGCEGTRNEVRFIEHVEIKTTISYSLRGALEIFLISPSGSTVQMLARRKLDKSKDGFVDWSFMSVMTWGEYAEGIWNLRISDDIGPKDNNGFVKDVQLVLHGTKILPEYLSNGPRNYNKNYNDLKMEPENWNTLQNFFYRYY